ncbi:MAG: hypothetical protein AB8B85_04085 [Paracoccaceae bacterium]
MANQESALPPPLATPEYKIRELEERLSDVTDQRDDALQHIERLEQRHEGFKAGIRHAIQSMQTGGAHNARS